MATFLDIGLIQKMNFLFPFLLVVVLSYAVLTKIEMFKEKKGLAAIVAFVFGMITLTSDIAIKTINKMSPWFVLVIIFGILLLIIFQAMGIKEDAITSTLTGDEYGSTFSWWIIGLILIITLGSLAMVISEEQGFSSLTNTDASDEEASFWASLFHPKILGMVLIFMVAYFTINRMTKDK